MEQQLTLAGCDQYEAVLKRAVEVNDSGAFIMNVTTPGGALEVVGAAFGLVTLNQRCESHLNWLVGDLLGCGSSKFGDEFDQELDAFAEVAGWSRRRMVQRERTSALFSDVRLRRHSYDEHNWASLMKAQDDAGIHGVGHPLTWNHYRELGLVAGVDVLTLSMMVQIAYALRGSPQSYRHLLNTIIGLSTEEYTMGDMVKELLETASESPSDAMDLIDRWLAVEKEDKPKGKYLLFNGIKVGACTFERVAELSVSRFESANLCLKIKGSNVFQVQSYDGFEEELLEIVGQV